MRVVGLAMAAALAAALSPTSGAATGPAWDRSATVYRVFDVGGPMTHGAVVVAGSAALYLWSPSGELVPFAGGRDGYHDDAGGEAYLAVSPGLRDAAAGCTFARDDIYALRLHDPIGVTRVDEFGQVSGLFTALEGATALSGIAFDTSGAFSHRLLVSGPLNGLAQVFAIDCSGKVRVITRSAPAFEGGLAVAPMSFGGFGGTLIAPDELTGRIWSIGPDGSVRKVVDSGLPSGGDTGVEAVAFVPPGFSRGGDLYFSDRGTPGSAHPGTDSLLRLTSDQLVAAGVQDGDLLSATEGGATMIDVRCRSSCTVTTVVGVPTTAHGEGHLVFTLNPAAPSSSSPAASPVAAPTPSSTAPKQGSSSWMAPAAAAGLIFVIAACIVWLVRRRRRV